jgi:hypothetical protein
MTDLRHYRFTSAWDVDATPGHAYEVLGDLLEYQRWWPEIKEMRQRDDGSVDVRARSLLPYDLRFTMRRTRQDPDAGVLEVAMTGELEGFSRFTVTARSGGSRVLFEEEVVTTNKKLLDRLAPVARPAFKANHAVMMRHGLAGLRTYLAGFRRARESS